MLAFVKGTVEEVIGNGIVIDHNGLGFLVYTVDALGSDLSLVGSEIKLYTSMQVREDDISLYGFENRIELKLFERLISVSGVGPRIALSILSTLPVEDLKFAIMTGDAKSIAKANGIGLKGAQKVILELKDKIDFVDDEQVLTSKPKVDSKTDKVSEATNALQAMGFTGPEIMKALKNIEDVELMSLEQLISEILRNMNY